MVSLAMNIAAFIFLCWCAVMALAISGGVLSGFFHMLFAMNKPSREVSLLPRSVYVGLLIGILIVTCFAFVQHLLGY